MEQIKDGVLEKTVNDWDELLKFTRYFSDDLGFIFRGQSDSTWPLLSSMERFLNKLGHRFKNQTVFSVHQDNFKKSLRGRGINFLDYNENELWALGQHYGLYSPLLDWTYSFHVALFFSFIEDIEPKNGLRSIYALHKKSIIQKAYEYNQGKDKFEKFEIVESMSNENPRIVNQAGLFTKIPFNFDIQQWVSENYKEENNSIYFFKINIPESERMKILKELNLMNISPKTIYPDLNGASLDCNFQLTLLADKASKIIHDEENVSFNLKYIYKE